MRFFLRNQPDNLTLVVISRTLPPLGIANLRVREQLFELDDQLLAFNHQEAQQFFLNRLPTPMDEQESATLCDEVEGWATALQLIALSAPESRSSVHQSARRLSGLNTTYLWEYLAEEVMDRIDAPTRDFLLRCSVLRSMNDTLVTRLTGRQDGLAQLSDLERRGLFYNAWIWMAILSGSVSIRYLLRSCSTAVSRNWRLSCRNYTVVRRRAGRR